jgi:hypothetical protein
MIATLIKIRDCLRTFFTFNCHLTIVLFLPVLLYLQLILLQTFILTVACSSTGYGCSGAVNADRVVSMYAGAMMSLQGSDEFVPNDKRRAAR